MINSAAPLFAPNVPFDIAEQEQQVEVFPNPATDELMVNLRPFIGQKATLSIVTINGQTLELIRIGEIEDMHKRLDVSALNNGAYILRIESADELVTKRFIVQRK